MTAIELVEEIEGLGGMIKLDGDRIRYGLPEEAAPLVEVLRVHREEVVNLLRDRERVPSMPPVYAFFSGIRSQLRSSSPDGR
jgi:hypothetical protein